MRTSDSSFSSKKVTTWGNVTWTEDHDKGTTTVVAHDNAFQPFTVGLPKNKINLECGHKFNVGSDFSETVVVDGVEKYKTHIHCIQCQKLRAISFWENSHHLDIPINLAF